MRLLVTRPIPHGARTATALERAGHSALLAPLLAYADMPVGALADGRYAGVVITSAWAAEALARHPHARALLALPVFAVGDRSTEAARAAGFGAVHSAAGDGAALAALILKQGPGPLLYAAGDDRAFDLGAALAGHGIPVETAVVYRAVPATTLPDDARQALAAKALDGVLHFSRRTATAFRDCAAAAGLIDEAAALTHYCLSRQVADGLEHLALPARIRIAPLPNEASLLGLLRQA